MPKILDDKELKLLRTKIIYHELDNATDDCQNNILYKGAKDLLDNNYRLHSVSDKILRALCYVNKKILTDAEDSDICNFAYYWLGDILTHKIMPISLYHTVILALFRIFKKINDKEQFCTAPTYYNINEVGYFNDIKLFFDYSKDYDIYINQLDAQIPPLCNEEYMKYLQKYVETYKKFQIECQNKSPSPGYCNAFKKYFDKKNSTNLSNWKCNLQNNASEAEQDRGESKKMKDQLLPAHEMREQSVTLSEGLGGRREQVVERLSISGHPTDTDTSELSIVSGPEDKSSISTTKSIATAASVAGILVPPFLVYNFTPLRFWINKLLGRNQIYRNPLTERELIENSYQPHHIDSERNRYNISYRPE
ncbi:PIR protein [Plasmodium vivax]|nr:PIR protein [Plasmodium vivax]